MHRYKYAYKWTHHDTHLLAPAKLGKNAPLTTEKAEKPRAHTWGMLNLVSLAPILCLGFSQGRLHRAADAAVWVENYYSAFQAR